MLLLNTKQKQILKGKAHTLKPIVFTGINGLTDNVIKEVDRGLEDHELIKIRIQENDRELRNELFQTLCETVSAQKIQLIGSIGVMYRKKKDEQKK